MDIGSRLKEIRKEHGLSQSAFATSIGVTQDSISLWERNKRIPEIAHIIKICNKYNVSADFILGIEKINKS